MSVTISVLNPKGGSGKTTLSTNLARALQLARLSVLLVDTDPQGTARDWAAARAEDDTGAFEEPFPGVIAVTDRSTLAGGLGQITQGFDVAVVDGSAKTQALLGATVRASDLVLIPVQPSGADLWGVADLVEAVRTRQDLTGGEPEAAFVVSRQISGTRFARDLGDALDSYEIETLEARITQRVVFAEALSTGTSVMDIEAASKASVEIVNLADDALHMVDLLDNVGLAAERLGIRPARIAS